MANGGSSYTKIDNIKEEMEEAQLKVDMGRDSLAADIYSLMARESDFAKVHKQKSRILWNGWYICFQFGRWFSVS